MNRSSESTAQVREHFRRKAFSFDHLYDEEHALQRLLRPGLFNRRELAVSVVRTTSRPRVLDVGGGSGRVGEFALDAGASRYVDIDLSDTMLELARQRLERFGDKVELVQGDFLTAPLEGPFDVVLALGYFDYIEDAAAHIRRISRALLGLCRRELPALDVDEGADPQAPLRGQEQGADLRLHRVTAAGLFADFKDHAAPGPQGVPVASRS